MDPEKQENITIPPNKVTFWANRRRLAYMSFFALVIFGVVALFKSVTQYQASVLEVICGGFVLVLLSYILAATAEDIVKIKG